MGESGADTAAVEVDDVLVLTQREDDALIESIRTMGVDQADSLQEFEAITLRCEMTAQVPTGRIADAQFSNQDSIMHSAPVEVAHRLAAVIQLLLIKSRSMYKYSRGV